MNKSEELPEEDLRDVVSGDDLQPQPHVQQYPPHCHSVRIPTLIFIFVASDTRFGPLALIDCGQSQLFRRHRRCVARPSSSRSAHKDVNGTKCAQCLPNGMAATTTGKREISVWETRKQKRFMSFEPFFHIFLVVRVNLLMPSVCVLKFALYGPI